MSLVAYGSSDESDSEDTPKSLEMGGKSSGLFASLPAPKKSAPEPDGLKSTGPSMGLNLPPPKQNISQTLSSPQLTPSFMSNMDPRQNSDPDGGPPAVSGGLQMSLPKPKKRSEPVKITIPELQRGDSDSDEEEPVSKKALSQASGGGLSSLLPQPRNLVVKETQRALVPHALTKRPQETRVPARPTGAAPGPPSATSPSPSAIKAAAKSAALQLARQIAQDDEGSDEELAPENYFSLPDSSQPPPVMPALDPDPPAGATLPLPPGTEAPFQSDAPLDFASTPQNYPGGSSGAWEGHQQESYYPRYPESASHGPQQEQFSQDYYSGAYYQDPDPGVTEMEQPGSSSLFDDEAFRRLQGKRNRGKEEVKFLEIKGDDQLSGSQQWMTKSMTEEKEQRKSFSKKKGEQPTGQQRRKHQITYLIHQAKERELELKNSWAENKLTRRQTQAKYGF
ncbi:hypothetical protein AGOR_G00034330 [Albula goreensis]|uniref:Proline-rich protein PRCC n=1 Tax=Albula goreensis TaxID=1534307 RepID=A0A8T3E1E0_9TELE|nr:hypothetical protein AGOR_G00034330 [Albula goreensis]